MRRLIAALAIATMLTTTAAAEPVSTERVLPD